MAGIYSSIFIDRGPIGESTDIFSAVVMTEVWSINETVGLPWTGFISNKMGVTQVSDPDPPSPVLVIGGRYKNANSKTPKEMLLDQIENRINVRLSPAPELRNGGVIISSKENISQSRLFGLVTFPELCVGMLPHFKGWANERERQSRHALKYMKDRLGDTLNLPPLLPQADPFTQLAMQTVVFPGLVLASEIIIDTHAKRAVLVVGKKTADDKYEATVHVEGIRPVNPPKDIALIRRLYTGPRSRQGLEFAACQSSSFAHFEVIDIA